MRVRWSGVGLLLIAAVALLGGATWLLTRDGSGTDAYEISEAPSRAPAELSPRAQVPAEPSPDGASTPVGRATPDDASRDESAEPVGVELTIVDAATKLPEPDAIVWYIDPSEEVRELREQLWDQSDLLVDQLGQKLEIDRYARVTLPAESPLLVVARATDRFGRASIRRSDGPKQQLVLQPDLPLKVRVVDPRGARVGDAPVVLDEVAIPAVTGNDEAARRPDPLATMSLEGGSVDSLVRQLARDGTSFLWDGKTSRDAGEAEVSHGARLLLDFSEPDRVARRRALRFRLAVPSREENSLLVDPRLDVHDAVVLVAPDLSTVRVSVIGADGAPAATGFRVITCLEGVSKLDAKKRARFPTGGGVSGDGSPLSLVVPIQEQVELRLLPDDPGLAARLEVVATPEKADECKEVTIRLEKRSTLRTHASVGRAIAPDGRVLANIAISAGAITFFGETLGGTTIRTDEHGVFTIPEGRSGMVCMLAPLSNAREGRDPSLCAVANCPPNVRGESQLLGDVQFKQRSLLLSGRVTSPDGHGIPHAKVRVWWRDLDVFNNRPDQSIVTDRAGRFEMRESREVVRPSTLRVSAIAIDWFTPGTTIDEREWAVIPTEKFATGATDVQLVLHRCGSARGEFQLESGVEPTDLILDPNPRSLIRAEFGPKNTFRIIGPPWSCLLTVKARGGSILTDIPHVELREDCITDDFRLQPLDLTGTIRMPIAVVGSDGAPIRGAVLVVLPPVGRTVTPSSCVTDPFGRESIIAARGDGPLLVAAVGRRLESVPIQSIEKRIVLREGIHVTVSLAVPADIPATIVGHIVAEYESPLRSGGRDGAVIGRVRAPAPDAPLSGGVFKTVLCGAGYYRIRVSLRGSDRWTPLHGTSDSSRIMVVDAAEPQRFELHVHPDELRRVVELLRE